MRRQSKLDRDFGLAEKVYDKIIVKVGRDGNIPPLLFGLCLIYARLHSKPEAEGGS